MWEAVNLLSCRDVDIAALAKDACIYVVAVLVRADGWLLVLQEALWHWSDPAKKG